MINFIRNLRIRLKLYILIGVALLGMLVIGGMSFILMGRLNEKATDISTSWLPSIDAARDMSATITNIRLNELTYLTATSDGARDSSQQYIQQEKEDMDKLLALYEELADEEERGYCDTAMSLWTQYSEADERMMGLAKEGRTEEARSILEGECVELYDSLYGAFDDIVTYDTKGSAAETSESMALYRNAVILMGVIIAGVILVGIYFSFVVIRLIKFPISEIENAAVKMAHGDLDVEISYTSRDELGELSEQMRKLIRKLRAIIDDETQFLARMAEGDFTVDTICEEEYTGGFHPVLISFRGIAEKLNSTMLQIDQSSAQVASGSQQVSDGAQALSQGATEQASSVQELAATIDDISVKVNENAENAQQANTMADTVSSEMNISNEKMQHMIQAMNDISRCSSEIGKIIKTIEDIAFQTNILALNAAVEAARAGAAGKGFAVVADEVRSLASKSAEASSNTSILIENSLQAVERGAAIAGETAEALTLAVEGAQNITSIVSKISTASNDQAQAIAQVTEGVDQISSVVQTNSATAQQSAAASEELSDQAQILKEFVGRFRIKE